MGGSLEREREKHLEEESGKRGTTSIWFSRERMGKAGVSDWRFLFLRFGVSC